MAKYDKEENTDNNTILEEEHNPMGGKNEIKERIFKELKIQNETKHTLLVRLHILVMCTYFLLNILSVLVTARWYVVAMCVPWFIIYCVFFYLTFLNRIKLTFILNQVITLVFIISFVIFFGWECGAQNFLFVMAVLIFATKMYPRKTQILHAVVLFAVMLLLFFHVQNVQPFRMLAAGSSLWFQIINSVAIFVDLIFFICIIVGSCEDLERRLGDGIRKLDRMAEKDPMTELYDRRSMIKYAEELRLRKHDGKSEKLCLAIGDIDNLRKINEKYGFGSGDIVILQLSNFFRQFMEDKGMACRYDGDAFLLMFDEMNGEDAYYYLVKLQQAIAKLEIRYEDEYIKITMSYGLIECTEGKSIESCLCEAERKLCMGKTSGKNTIIF